MEIQSDDCTRNADENFGLHKLDDICLLKIFKYLRFEDARNLSRTSKRLKNLFLFKYHNYTFEFRSDMLIKTTGRGSKVFDVILLEYGGHIRSWSLEILNKQKNDAIEMVRRVSECSMNLKRLQLKGITNMDFLNCPEVIQCLRHVETLSCVYCHLMESATFLQYFRNLKQLHLTGTSINDLNLQILFNNNKEIESYYYDEEDMLSSVSQREKTKIINDDFVLREFGPKFNASCPIEYEKIFPIGLDMLLTTNLTKLKLASLSCNVDKFLITLAKQQPLMLKEFELQNVWLGAREFEAIVTSFQKLETLIVDPLNVNSIRWAPSTWPKYLRIFSSNILFEFSSVALLIRTASSLNQLHLRRVDFPRERLTQVLEDPLITERRSGRLEVVINHCKTIRVNYIIGRSPNLKFRNVGTVEKIKITKAQQKLTKGFAY